MRISTAGTFSSAATFMMGRQSDLAKLSAQISSGRRILTPSDDPAGAARVIELENAKARGDQLRINQTSSTNTLSQAESTLGNISDAYADMQDILAQAGNAAYSNGDRKILAAELAARRDALTGLSATRDADGQTLFGSRLVRVSNSRELDVSLNSNALFGRVRDGNGVFAARADSANTGASAISAGTVADAAALDGNSYDIVVHDTAGVLTYDIINAATTATVSSGNAFSNGGTITVAGMSVKITGSPADGDSYHLMASTTRSVFQTLDDMIQALKAPVSDDVSRAQLSANIAAGLAQLGQAAETAQLTRASAGAALKEIDTLQAVGAVQDEQLQIQIAGVRDLDYTKAVTDLSQRQLVLDAAQRAYAKTLGRSLFEYL